MKHKGTGDSQVHFVSCESQSWLIYIIFTNEKKLYGTDDLYYNLPPTKHSHLCLYPIRLFPITICLLRKTDKNTWKLDLKFYSRMCYPIDNFMVTM